jgi:hypothetical protein
VAGALKLGLIARCEQARGLAILSKNFYDHMPVTRTLCVRVPYPAALERPDWYENRTNIRFNPKSHTLDEAAFPPWLEGLDVVFCAETPHDWRIPDWCRRLGVKLVIQGMPEFVRHMREDSALQHPDQWWWPTSWRLDHLPPGIVMPVPMDRHPMTRSDDDRLHILHTVGKRAFADRNGTEILVQAMRMVRSEVKLTIHSIDGDIIPFQRKRNVEYVFNHNAVDNLWSMYGDQDVLILPRRYGGLSLPALEASAAGLIVAMTDCPPNDELASVLFPVHRTVSLTVASGVIPSFDANAAGLASTIDLLANLSVVERDVMRQKQARLLPTWDVYGPRYLRAFEALL